MPKSIQIRDVPDDVHRRLRARALAAGLSLSDYLREELGRIDGRAGNVEVLERAAQREGGVSREAIVAAIRADRGD